MTKLGLTLNEAKTSLKDARKERFEFLGYSFGPHYWWKNGQWYLGASPSKKSVQRIKAKISELLVPGNKGSWPDVGDRLILPARSHRYGSCEYTHVLQVLARDALSFASSWLS